MKLPHPVPELPVDNIQVASQAYSRQMGFDVNWTYEDSFAGISKDDARVFLRRRTTEEASERYRVTVWLNMSSAAEVDQLYADWKERGVSIEKALHTTDYNLREFTAQDVDGNSFRVFYDLGGAGA